MSEIALVSSKKFKLENAAKKGSPNAKKALELSNNPGRFLSTVQIGITLIGILLGFFSGDTITATMHDYVVQVPFLAKYAQPVSVGLVVLLVTFFSIVLGELVPKQVGLIFPESISVAVARPMDILSKIASPFVWLLISTNDFLLRLFNIKAGDNRITEEEIKSIISESAEGGEIQEIEQDIVERVFALGDRKASSIMTYRTDLVWLDLRDDWDTVKRKIGEEAHSAYPVAKDNIDDILGIIILKDMFRPGIEKNFSIADYMKQPLYVHENIAAYKVLEEFREKKIHYAIVVDEFGSTQGMITMDDILDALFGEFTEYNQEEYTIVKRDDTSWFVDAQFSYYEFLRYFELDIFDEKNHTFQTVGGLIIDQLQGIPNVGDSIYFHNLKLEIIDMDRHRIDKILVSIREEETEERVDK